MGVLPTAWGNPPFSGDKAIGLGSLARQFVRPPYGVGFLTSTPCGGFFVKFTPLHFSEQAFSLHFLFQRFQSLINIVISDDNTHVLFHLLCFKEQERRQA